MFTSRIVANTDGVYQSGIKIIKSGVVSQKGNYLMLFNFFL